MAPEDTGPFQRALSRLAPAGRACRRVGTVATGHQAKTVYKVAGGAVALAAFVGLAMVAGDKLDLNHVNFFDTGGKRKNEEPPVNVGLQRFCPTCAGRGVVPPHETACPTCLGTGLQPA